MATGPIKVLVVEDSPVMRELLVHVLDSDPKILVIGTANNGAEALEALAKNMPDVITMDINMPKMNGFELTRIIMETNPVPIVIVSATWKPAEVAITFRAMEAGAVAIIQKPRGIGHPEFSATRERLLETVKSMAEVKVIRRWSRLRKAEHMPVSSPATGIPARTDCRIVAIGASTGGPLVLQTILAALPTNFPVPILIVQHIAAGFTTGLVEWLRPTTGFLIQLGEHGLRPLPGHAYIAPDGSHMGVDASQRIVLSKAEPDGGLRPSVSYLFHSIADVFGRCAVGILLTGMGKDGAEELKRMRDLGAITIAQNKPSSIVHGMPGAAIKLNGATYILPPDQIASTLQRLIPSIRSAR